MVFYEYAVDDELWGFWVVDECVGVLEELGYYGVLFVVVGVYVVDS